MKSILRKQLDGHCWHWCGLGQHTKNEQIDSKKWRPFLKASLS